MLQKKAQKFIENLKKTQLTYNDNNEEDDDYVDYNQNKRSLIDNSSSSLSFNFENVSRKKAVHWLEEKVEIDASNSSSDDSIIEEKKKCNSYKTYKNRK